MSVLGRLEGFDAFRRLGPKAKALIESSTKCRNAAPMAAVLHKGQKVSGAYVVLSGRLRVFTIAPNGVEATLYFIDPGETCVLALNCLFNDLLYPAWVQAEAATSVALISGAAFRTLFETEPAIQNLTVQALSTLVYRLMGELERIHTSHHKERLAQFILAQAASDGVLRMTQQQLAQHLGTTREVIARLMQNFVAKGYVQTQRGRIIIRNLPGLRRLIVPDRKP